MGLLLAVALAACGPASTPTPGEPAAAPPVAGNPLAGIEWRLVSLRGDPLLEGTYISIEFDEDRLGGYAGCNHYGGGPDSGGYAISSSGESGGTIEIPMLAITQMECLEPEGVMDQEAAYTQALASATSYRLEGDTLALQGIDDETVLTFEWVESSAMDPAALLGTAWRLVSLDGQPPLEGSTLTLAWHNEHRAGGNAGCRAFVAGYEAQGDELSIVSMAMMGADCTTEALQQQESDYTTILGWANRFHLDGDRLELYTVRGEVLTYEALPAEGQPAMEGPTWKLLALVESRSAAGLPQPVLLPSEALPGSEITAAFAGGEVSGIAGCNQYGGSYSLNGAELAVSDLFQTEMACLEPEGIMEQEARYLEALRQATAARVYGRQLWLETAEGLSLVFTTQ